jgi:hypothetical protein
MALVVVIVAMLVGATLTATSVGATGDSKVVYDTFGQTGQSGAQFIQAGGLAVNNTGAGGAGVGDVYVADRNNHRVQRFTANGTFIAAWGFGVSISTPGNGYEICTSASDCKAGIVSVSPAPGGEFSQPVGVAVNQLTGHVYVSDRNFFRVQELTATGTFVRAWGQDVVSAGPGNMGTGFEICVAADGDTCKTGVGGTVAGAFGAQLTGSPAIAPAGAPNAGNVIVADQANRRVQEFDSDGDFVRAIGGGVVAGTTSGTGDLTDGQTTVSSVTTTAGAFVVGQTITGAGISAGTRIATVGAGSVTLSQPATATAAGTTLTVIAGVDNVPNNERQTVMLADTVSGGTFELAFTTAAPSATTAANNTTADIPYNASAADVQSALEALGNIGAGAVSVTSPNPGGGSAAGGPYTVEFQGTRYADTNVAQMTASSAGLTDGNVAVSTSTEGASGFEVCTVAADCVTGVAFDAAIHAGGGAGQFGTATPNRVAADAQGAIYAVENTGNFRVHKLSPSAGAQPLAAFIFAPSSLSGTAAGTAPGDITVDPTTNDVYAMKGFLQGQGSPPAASAEHRVLQLSSAGSPIGAHGAQAGLQSGVQVGGLALDPVSGRLYVSSLMGSRWAVSILIDPLEDAPAATTGAATAGAAAHTRTLEGTVNPGGFKLTNCYFEFGETTEYGATTPCEPAHTVIGDGATPVAVSASTEALEPETTYHYRLVASNVSKTGTGADATFTTGDRPADSCANAAIRAAQGIETVLLPGCMALEQATPPEKTNQFATGGRLSPSGDRMLFVSIAALGGTPYRNSVFGDKYVASRSAAGWSTVATNPPLPYTSADSVATGFTPDYDSWMIFGSTHAQASFMPKVSQLFRKDLAGEFDPYSPLLEPISGEGHASWRATSSDGSKVFYEAGFNADKATSYDAADPQPQPFNLADRNTYIASRDSGQPSLALLARDKDGKAWGGNCGARLGGSGLVLGGAVVTNGLRTQGAVSADGGRVYLMARPDQPASGPCSHANGMRILERTETPSGPVISELIDNECDRPALPTPCATHTGDDVYQGASLDQTRVYFTTSRQLADSDVDGTATRCSAFTPVVGCDLYLYDSTQPEGQRLTHVSAGEGTAATPGSGAAVRNSITAISADGSHVYFVARTVLTTDSNPAGDQAEANRDNLYVYRHPQGDLAFVGTLASADSGQLFGGNTNWENGAFATPTGDTGPGEQPAGDGHLLVFRTNAALTDDDQDTAADIYRYDRQAEALQRVSKAMMGGEEGGSTNVVVESAFLGSFARWVDESASSVVFTTTDGLVAADVNGAEDGYLWRDGAVYLLPASDQKPGSRGSQPTISADGETVAFASNEQLLPSDGDSVQDVYVARVNGGQATVPAAGSCDPVAGACQGAGAAPTAAHGERTSSTGDGNAVSGERKRLVVSRLSRKARRRAARSGVLAVRVRTTSAGLLRVLARGRIGKRTRRVAGRRVRVRKAGAVTVRLRLNRAARRRLRRGRSLNLTVQVRSHGARPRSMTVRLPGVKS